MLKILSIEENRRIIEKPAVWNGEDICPKRLTIETIFGCNASCPMCVINHKTRRKKGIMSLEKFKKVVDDLSPFCSYFQMCDLFGLGEPLLEPHIFKRIKYMRDRGFRNLAISTNADLMDKDKSKALLDTGIETVIFSLDGIRPETHEKIRRGVSYERVVNNIHEIIGLRDKRNYNTRFIIRFIRQKSNKDEWEEYLNYWSQHIKPGKKDFITSYNMHSWGGLVQNKDEMLVEINGRNKEIERAPCHHAFDIITILADGTVPLCSEDELSAEHDFGNAFEVHPLEIFNSVKFKKIRELHVKGRKNTLMPCKDCTVLYSEAAKRNLQN